MSAFFCTVTSARDVRTTLVVEAATEGRAAYEAARLLFPRTNGQGVKSKATPLP